MYLFLFQIEAVSGRQVTCRQIADEAIKCASALYRHGLRRGDVVATCTSNNAEYAIVVLAAAACGATVTTCNPLYTVGKKTLTKTGFISN